jgi:exonuclease III
MPLVPPRFRVILKNARSLQSADRFEELRVELQSVHWDVAMFTETWRLEREEFVRFDTGDIWVGAGGAVRSGSGGGKHGVGILVHRRWAGSIIKFVCSSSFCPFVDLKLSRVRLRLICVYMPHCGYSDDHVEAMYQTLEVLVTTACRQGCHTLLAGDWNAEVGVSCVGDCEKKSAPTVKVPEMLEAIGLSIGAEACNSQLQTHCLENR